MIPSLIHYCWFGGKPLPRSAIKCINSWKEFFPDYEIKEWNESNYDVRKIPYIAEAYDAKKYAFVSDYARFDILYNYGGLYFDTDVEVIKSYDDILARGAFMGCEVNGDQSSGRRILVNPGLGLASDARNPLYKEILEYYKKQSFLNSDGSLNTMTVVTRTTEILKKHGLKNNCGFQTIEGIVIYPKDYFNPRNNNTGVLEKTDETHSIHWYAQSWDTSTERLRSKLTRPIHRVFGEDCFRVLKESYRRIVQKQCDLEK